MKDYSQSGEQAPILAALKGLKQGRVLDVGAADGVTFSHSRALLEQGWGGVLIEPEAAAFLKLHDLYQDRDDVLLGNFAVGTMSQLQMFHATRDLVSTVDPAHFAKWSGVADYVGRYVISVISAVELMRMGPFDFINIDTEGTSAAIGLFLLETMYESDLPKVLCIEHDQRSMDLLRAGSARGYRQIFQNAENLILSR